MEVVANMEREFARFVVSKGMRDSIKQHFSQILLELEDHLITYKPQGKDCLFGAENPSMADLFLFPFMERIVLMKETCWKDTYYTLDVDDHAKCMIDYVHKFRQNPKLKDQLMDLQAYDKWLHQFRESKYYNKPEFQIDYLQSY